MFFISFSAAVLGDIKVNDTLMRFFDLCDKFVRDVENNSEAMHELDGFKNGPEMKKVIERVANKLCLQVDELNAGDNLFNCLHCLYLLTDFCYYTNKC